MPELTTFTPLDALRLASLFELRARSADTAPLEQQWYWPRVQRLLHLADAGLHPRVWIEELMKELGL